MSTVEKIDKRLLKTYLTLKRAMVTLSPYVQEMEIKSDERGIFITGVIYVGMDSFTVTIKPDRMLRRVTDELVKKEPAMIGGRISVDDVKLCLAALYSPLGQLTEHISEIRRVTGLFKSEKIRRFIVWRRIKAKELKDGKLKTKRTGRKRARA